MSIMNGHAELDNGRSNGGGNRNNRRDDNQRSNNSGNRSNNNRNDNNRNRRNYENRDYRFSKSSYLTDEAREEMNNNGSDERSDRRAEEIYDFLDEFKKYVDDFQECRLTVTEKFPNIVKYVRNYYSQKNSPSFNDAINKLILAISTTNFANALQSVLEHGDWDDDSGTYGKCWRSIAFALSVALETAHDRMHGSVISKYATEILPRMWKPEIQDIATSTGVTKDLALDLIIAIPMIDSEWNSANIDAFYGRFLDKMLIHAEDNMDVLNWEVQGMLYKKVFGSGKPALQVIGKYLTSEPREKLDTEVEQAVYQEFIKMIYSKLDEYDIKDIMYVFRYVANIRKSTDNAPTIFNAKDAKSWDNVRKGMLQVMEQDKDTMNFLA